MNKEEYIDYYVNDINLLPDYEKQIKIDTLKLMVRENTEIRNEYIRKLSIIDQNNSLKGVKRVNRIIKNSNEQIKLNKLILAKLGVKDE